MCQGCEHQETCGVMQDWDNTFDRWLRPFGCRKSEVINICNGRTGMTCDDIMHQGLLRIKEENWVTRIPFHHLGENPTAKDWLCTLVEDHSIHETLNGYLNTMNGLSHCNALWILDVYCKE